MSQSRCMECGRFARAGMEFCSARCEIASMSAPEVPSVTLVEGWWSKLIRLLSYFKRS